MPIEVRIQCVNKTNRQDPHERIHSVGGVNPDGTPWKMTQTAAIQGIKDGTYKFWTFGGGKSVWVVIATHNSREYLKTEADGVHPNNLLALPECS